MRCNLDKAELYRHSALHMTINQHILYFWLSVCRITPLRVQKLLEVYSIDELFDRVRVDKKIADLVSEVAYKKLCDYTDLNLLQKSYDKLYEYDVKFLSIADSNYPIKLKQSNILPPVGFYYRGDVSLLDESLNSISIVGTRRCSEYGKDATYKFSSELSDHGFVVVSGLATGIDAYTHDAVLKNGGKAVAVLGMGHAKFSPQDNLKLFKQICEKGLVLSEYPPTFEATKYTFPERNRIVSALSDAVIIIEANKASGALITANRALEQGKEIFAVPGNISSPKSFGTNELIKNGAQLLSSTQDILKYFSIKNAKNPQSKTLPPLDLFEQNVYNALSDGELSYDQLYDKCKLSGGELSGILVSLEIKNIAVRKLNNKYALVEY